MKAMQCCRGHELVAPYFYLGALKMQGAMTDETQRALEPHLAWFGGPEGQIPQRLICANCILDLLQHMDEWRTNEGN